MTNAEGSVDEKLGAQYGDYARSAAQSLSGFSQSLDAKDIDQLLDEARDFVRKSPAIAIGTAAAVGFVLARLVKSGFDTDTADAARAWRTGVKTVRRRPPERRPAMRRCVGCSTSGTGSCRSGRLERVSV